MSNNNLKNFLLEDGSLKIESWAKNDEIKDGFQQLSIDMSPKHTKMAHSVATGEGLVSNGFLGADIIHVRAGTGFVPHTHPGDHLLIVLGGEGTITYNGKIYPTHAGQIYMVEGKIPHAVGAITDHSILAVGAPHKPVDATERMKPVEYQEVVANIDELHCLICNKVAKLPRKLHDLECKHCPCYDCIAH